MKKLILVITLMVALLAGPVYAGTDVNTVIAETVMSQTNPSIRSGTLNISGADKVSFFVHANTNADSVSAQVTVEMSADGITWLQAQFKDFAGGTTLQSSQDDMNDNYYLWLDGDIITAPYVRIGINMMNPTLLDVNGTEDEATISVQIIREK